MVNTAWSLARWTSEHPDFDLALNIGIAGSYRRDLALGDVVQIVQDSYAELGADSPEGFLGLEDLGFPLMKLAGGENVYNTLHNPHGLTPPPESLACGLSRLTVSRNSTWD